MAEKIISVAMSEAAARQTAKDLGSQYSSYGMSVNGEDGYVDDAATALNWFVTFDEDLPASKIFGYSFEEIQARQMRT